MGAFVKNNLAQGLAKEPTRSNFQAGRPEGTLSVQGTPSTGQAKKKVKKPAKIIDRDQSHLSDLHAAGSSTLPDDAIVP